MLHVTDPASAVPSGSPPSRQRGFTLTELVVVLAIVAMAALITIPNLQRMRVRAAGAQALRQVTGAFDLARFEATKRHSPVGVIYDSMDRSITVWEDWDPNNDAAATPTNNNQALDGAELVIDRRTIPAHLIVVGSPPGDTDPQPSIGTVSYAFDGTLRAGGGAAYLGDRIGNVFRVRVNPVTGEVREEFWQPSNKWSVKREDWKWKY